MAQPAERDPEQEILEEMKQRAVDMEPNEPHPGEPTLTAIIAVLLHEVAALRARLDQLDPR
jgi:hypothetical protein